MNKLTLGNFKLGTIRMAAKYGLAVLLIASQNFNVDGASFVFNDTEVPFTLHDTAESIYDRYQALREVAELSR